MLAHVASNLGVFSLNGRRDTLLFNAVRNSNILKSLTGYLPSCNTRWERVINAKFFFIYFTLLSYERCPFSLLSPSCLRLVLGLLVIWFNVSFGCGILFREWLDANRHRSVVPRLASGWHSKELSSASSCYSLCMQ